MEHNTAYQSIILIGRAGTGKGTQAKKIADALSYEIFSTGEKSREIAAQDTPLGRHIAAIHTTGWIPEWLASYVMTKALLDEYPETGLVFESVARKPEEARKLHEIHSAIERPYVVLYLDCDKEILTERLLKRGRAGYDTEEKITKRAHAFETETMQSIEFFKAQGALKTINADQTVEAVFTDIMKAIEN